MDDRLTLVRVRVRVRTLVPWFSPTRERVQTISGTDAALHDKYGRGVVDHA